MEPVKFVLDHPGVPRAWYNIAADLACALTPVLRSGHRPTDRFGRSCAAGSAGPDPAGGLTAAWDSDRDAVRDVYRLWQPTPLFRTRLLEAALGTRSAYRSVRRLFRGASRGSLVRRIRAGHGALGPAGGRRLKPGMPSWNRQSIQPGLHRGKLDGRAAGA
jgi:hypothetical protein